MDTGIRIVDFDEWWKSFLAVGPQLPGGLADGLREACRLAWEVAVERSARVIDEARGSACGDYADGMEYAAQLVREGAP